MASQTTQLTYKPLQKSDGQVFSKTVSFDQLANFETVVKFTIAPKDTTPYDNGLTFSVNPATGGNLRSGSHVFGVLFDHKSDNPDYLKLEILIDYTTCSFVLVPKEFLGKELTLTASYVADTHEIKVSITYGSKSFQVILNHDLALILEGVVEGVILTPSKVDVSYWHFKWTSTTQ